MSDENIFETKKEKQLNDFKHEAGDILSTNQGIKISDNQNTLKAGERGPSLLEDFLFREKITHFDHERIPERVVHARGSGAHGYFQPYKSMQAITKAKFLSDPSIITPVFVRFSTVLGFRGSADTVRDVRGFATKFYTEEGNFDLVGNNIPVFFIQDGIKFPDIIHAGKPEPHHEIPQASTAHDNFWDFISLTPESMHMIMWTLSDRALPRSFSMMEGFGVHTFRLINENKESHFVKFHWKPINGIHSLRFDECQLIAGKDPDFNRRDLWESIENGNYPEFELGIQILKENELDKIEFDILDATKLWPEEDIPVQIIGKMVLNRNPDNFFAETEQVAFHVGNIVPGIDFTNDPLLQARLFSYLDTQLIRLGGPNFHEIPINRPLASIDNNQRDGFMRQRIDKGRINYEPNSLGGGCPMQALWSKGGYVSFPEKIEGEKVRIRPESFNDHYSQATLFWNSMSPIEKRHIIKAFEFELGKVEHDHIKKRMVEHLSHIDDGLATEVADSLGIPFIPTGQKKYSKSSTALSQEYQKKASLKGRKIAIFVEDGIDLTFLDELKMKLKEKGVTGELISKKLGWLDMNVAKIDKTFKTGSSVLYDAVFIPDNLQQLLMDKDAITFVKEAFDHCKPIIAIGSGIKLIESLSLPKENDEKINLGVLSLQKEKPFESLFAKLIKVLSNHRYWNRELLG